MNSDGRMDIHEFSIAMKLIKLKLQGHPLPPSLPPSMKQPPLPLPPQTGFGKTDTWTNSMKNKWAPSHFSENQQYLLLYLFNL